MFSRGCQSLGERATCDISYGVKNMIVTDVTGFYAILQSLEFSPIFSRLFQPISRLDYRLHEGQQLLVILEDILDGSSTEVLLLRKAPEMLQGVLERP